MKYSSKARTILSIAFASVLCACMGTVKPPEPIYYYTLDYSPPGPSFAAPVPFILRVERFSASPPYNTARIVYADAGAHRNTYAYHQWIAAPGDLLPYLLARDLEYTKGFQAVFTPESAIRTTHNVHAWIEQFLEKDTAQNWTAAATLHAALISRTAADPTDRILFQRRYSAESPCAAKTPAALAVAMGQVVSQISEAISRDIYQSLSAVGRSKKQGE